MKDVKVAARLRNTGEKFENTNNGYATFLNEKSELPRLSILDNYKQIMRIMTSSYIKGGEYQNKFKNLMEKDIVHDEEYMKYRDEQTNTKKMSTILKNLNHPVFMSSKSLNRVYTKAGHTTSTSYGQVSKQKPSIMRGIHQKSFQSVGRLKLDGPTSEYN